MADELVDTLASVGVRRFYGVAGDSLNAVTDSIRARPNLRWVHVRHEEAAAFAAGAEAQLTGELAVCAGSCGPGNLHLINGLYDAHRSGAPVLAIAAQIPSEEIGRDYFQETHPELIFQECSLFRGVVSRPDELGPVLGSAVAAATTGRGVSVLVLPGDVALMPAAGPAPAPTPPGVVPLGAPSESELAALASTLNAAQRVTILAGGGARAARGELFALADRLAAPIVRTLRAKETLEWENPFDVGMTGLIGFSSGYRAMAEADVILLLGTDFPYRQFYPDSAKKLQIDANRAHLGRRTSIELGVVADVGATIRALLPLLHPRSDRGRLTADLAHYRDARRALDDLAVEGGPKDPIHPQYVARTLDELAAPDVVFTCDVGLPTVWAARYLTMNGRRRLLGSFWHGSMANALPMAVGAAATDPARPVVSLCGDGGLAMLLGELLTLRQESLPVKVVVFDNSSLGFVELEQKSAGFLASGVDLVNPDFAEIANAAGILGLRATSPAEVRPMVAQLLAHPGPALLDVVVARQEIAMPPSLRPEYVRGFGLWLIKALLSGRGDEIVDLAKVNLFR